MKIDPQIKDKILCCIEDKGLNLSEKGSAETLAKQIAQEFDVSAEIIVYIIGEYQAGHTL